MDELENKIYDQWLNCWQTKHFPFNIDFPEYSKWRRFLDFWLLNKTITIEQAMVAYVSEIKKGNITV